MNQDMKQKIDQLKQNNNWQQIVLEFDEFLKPDRAQWTDLFLIKEVGFAHSQLGNFDRALQLYLRWQELQKDAAQPCYCIGYLYAQQNDYRKALDWYEKALEIYPSYFICLYRKGVCFLQLQKPKQARDVLEEADRIYTSSHNEDFKKRQRKNYMKNLFALGKAYFQLKEYQEALSRFQQVAEQDKKQVIHPIFKFYNIGKCYLELGEADRAEEYLKAALKINNKKEFLWERMGRLYHLVKKDSKQALSCFNKALECRPVAYIYVSRARLFYDMGETAKAISDYHIALKKDRMGKHKILLELAKIAIDQGKLREAEQYVHRAVDFKQKMYDADYAEAHYLLAQISLLKGEDDKARMEIQRANDINPNIAWDEKMLKKHSLSFYDVIIEEPEE